MVEGSKKGTDIPARKRGRKPCQKHEPHDVVYADQGFRIINDGTALARYACRTCGEVFCLPAVR
jgi:hypothetical protein